MNGSDATVAVYDIAAIVRESRATQGLPPKIQDSTILRRVAVLLDLTEVVAKEDAA